MRVVIYADILLVLNWWIDFLLLLAIRRTLGGGGRSWRLALGALFGAVTAFILFLPPLSVWLTLCIKLASAAGMIVLAFRWQGWRMYWRRVFLLFVFSAGLAGLCGAVYYWLAPQAFYVLNGGVYYAVSPLLLVVLSVVCYGLLWMADYLMRRRAPSTRLFRAALTVGGDRVIFPCLYDSGNHLTEPFSGYPVLVVERGIVEQLMDVPADADAIPVGKGWRLIPYDTVGGSGLLPACIPEKFTVTVGGEERVMPACYMAVCDSLGRGEYRGLLGSAMGDELI